MIPNPRLPFVGASAFAHKGGIHVAAILKVEASYQHIDPSLVGNRKRVLVSELSGRGNLVYKAQEFGLDASHEDVQQVLVQVKELESRGFYFEGAEASVALMLQRMQPDYRPPIRTDRLHGRGRASHGPRHVGGSHGKGAGRRRDHAHCGRRQRPGQRVGSGRCARHSCRTTRSLADIQLVDYKVRILNGDAATAAITRVIIEHAQRSLFMEHRRRIT